MRWLMARALCKRRFDARFAALAVAASTVFAAASATAQLVSTAPGPLARSHAKIDGPGGCKNCHAPGKGVVDARCVTCHKKVRKSVFHERLVKESGKKCSQCHRDHRGRDFRLIRFRPQPNFDHRKTGYLLKGGHRGVACASCHKKVGRWMGVPTDCASCHKDVHKPTLGGDCASCHTEKSFRPARKFRHDRARFKLRGGHKDVDCASCHPGSGAKQTFRGVKFSACTDCHNDPVPDHSGGQGCDDCHSLHDWADTTRKSGLRLHKKTDFPLRGHHSKVACTDCHKPSAKKKPRTPAARLASRTGLDTACSSCHTDPHQGRLGDNCAKCHSETSWKRVKKRSFDHDKTRFALKGRHDFVPCAACHAKTGNFKRRFKVARFGQCEDCHVDPHDGEFVSPKAGKGCEGCHTEKGFTPALFSPADHDKASFALDGRHEKVACNDCHKKAPTRPSPRARKRRGARNPWGARKPRRAHKKRRGRRITARAKRHPRQLIGTATACESCHKDPHDGQFAARKPPQGCADCHNNRSFKDVRIDHDATRFALAGPHKEAACEDCHKRDKAGGAVAFVGTSMQCKDCHDDVHGGQFASGGKTAQCDDCHMVVKDFLIKPFEHDKKTRFALTGKHTAVDCASCHRKVEGPTGPTVHYRLGQPACADCHNNPHGDRLVSAASAIGKRLDPRDCAACHSTASWSEIPKTSAFDHASTGVPLTGGHKRAPCSGCHKPAQRRDALADASNPAAAAKRPPVPRRCASCHTDPHRNELGDRCSDCHTSRNWSAPRQFPGHARTRFPLAGAHTATPCGSCHRQTGRDRFRGTPTSCDSCHRKTALRVKAFDHSRLGAGCQTCHSSFAWAPARFDHGRFWPLIGAHAAIHGDCKQCHTNKTFTGLNRACESCHMDTLKKRNPKQPDHFASGLVNGCDRCHSPVSWTTLDNGWHDKWFPISGGDHAKYRNSCSSCHPGGTGKGQFDCIHCHDGKHDKNKMDNEHDDEGGYVWANSACLNCHPNGEAD